MDNNGCVHMYTVYIYSIHIVYIYIYTHIYIYVYIYVYDGVCVCIYICTYVPWSKHGESFPFKEMVTIHWDDLGST